MLVDAYGWAEDGAFTRLSARWPGNCFPEAAYNRCSSRFQREKLPCHRPESAAVNFTLPDKHPGNLPVSQRYNF